MKASSIKELKTELQHRSQQDLINLCLSLAKSRTENKELLTYLLFERENEEGYINTIKEKIDTDFKKINTNSFFYMKKGVRKILRETKKFIRFSKKPETESILLLHFCQNLKSLNPPIIKDIVLMNMYKRQLLLIEKKITSLHEDLQYDFNIELQKLK